MTDPFDRPARPWDLFNKNLEKVTGDQYDRRMDICLTCEHIIKLTHQCKKCGCMMDLKTRLPNATCPVGKWGQIDTSDVSFTEEQ